MARAQQDLVGWLRKHGGVVHEHVDLMSNVSEGNRTVRAKSSIKMDEVLLQIPLECCLHVPSSGVLSPQQSKVPVLALLIELGASLSSFVATTLALMAEKSRGHDSPYWRHFDVMPATHACTLSWGAKDIALLRQTDFGSSLQEDVDGMYANEIVPITGAHPTVWPAEACTRAAFEWAAGMVQSRAFHLQASNWATKEITEGEDLYLLPAIDMLNHTSVVKNRATELECTFGGPGQGASSSHAFVMRAGRSIAPGEEILHTYGDLGNGELLQIYGFVEAPGVNSFDAVGFSTDEIVEAVRESGKDDSDVLRKRMTDMLLQGSAAPRMLVQAQKKPFEQLCNCILRLIMTDKEYDRHGYVDRCVSFWPRGTRLWSAGHLPRARERECKAGVGGILLRLLRRRVGRTALGSEGEGLEERADLAQRLLDAESEVASKINARALLLAAQDDDGSEDDDSEEEDASEEEDDGEEEDDSEGDEDSDEDPRDDLAVRKMILAALTGEGPREPERKKKRRA